MSSKRFFFVMTGAILLFTLLGAVGALQASKIIKKEGDHLVDRKLQKAVLDKQSADLLKAKHDLLEFEELNTLTNSIIPKDKDQARTIIEIVRLAKNSGIELGSIEFPASQLGQVSKGKTPTASDNNTTQLAPVKDIKGLYTMEIQLHNRQEAPVKYEQLIGFLQGLESNRRTAQVVNISIIPSTESPGSIDFDVTLNAYIRPEQ